MRRLLLVIFAAASTLANAAVTQEGAAKAAAVAAQPAVGGSLVKITLGLIFVIGLIFASAWLFRRFGSFANHPAGALKVLGGVSLGPREKAVLIKVGEAQLLVGVAPGNVRTLHVLDKPVAEGGAAGESNPSFAARLGAALKQRGTQ